LTTDAASNPGCKDLEEERGGKGRSTEEREGRKEWDLAELATQFRMLSKHNSSNYCSKIPKPYV
jgi:hypothetical protein